MAPCQFIVHITPHPLYLTSRMNNHSVKDNYNPYLSLNDSYSLMKQNTINVKGKTVKLMPGMAVTAEVKTGTRRIIEFFLAPLLQHGQESLRER